MAKATRGSKKYYKENKNMAKLFLGSVGTVEAFKRREDGSLELAFVSKTLTDSGINTTISKEDIRGGTGAPIQFSFYHDPSVEITLTDVVFKPEYLEAQLGTEFENEGAHGYASETVTANETGEITLKDQPLPIDFGACGGEIKCVWASEVGKEMWKTYPFTEGKTISGFKKDKKYCVRYCKNDPTALVAHVTSNIIPAEYMLIITAPVFAGDACSASNGTKAGTITYEIPRFRLNGGSEMAFNMSSNQTISLAGSAYATESGCDGEQNLYNIVLTLKDSGNNLFTELIVDEDCLEKGMIPVVYGLTKNGKVMKIDNKNLIFEPPLDSDGTFNIAGMTEIRYKLTEEQYSQGVVPVEDTVNVTGAD